MEIDVGFAAFGHPREMAVDPFPGGGHFGQEADRLVLVALPGHGDEPRGVVEQDAGLRLDRDVDQDEPVLVRPAVEVLEHRDIVEIDRTGLVDPVPVVEDVGGIGQQRGLPQAVRDRHDRPREVRGQVGRRLRLSPDVGLDEEGIVHHRGADLFFRRLARPVLQPRIGQGVQPVPDAAGGQQRGKLAGGFEHRGELAGEGDRIDLVMRKEAALARHSVVL